MKNKLFFKSQPEQLFIVSKKIPYSIACEIADKHFGSCLNYHCANFNDEWGHFDYPDYKDINSNYYFIGRII